MHYPRSIAAMVGLPALAPAVPVLKSARALLAVASVSGALCGATCAHAATFCVSSPGAFAAALSAAESNGESDIIYVAAGEYDPGAGLAFDSTEDDALTIVGGLDATCSNVTSGLSILNGQSLHRALYISTDGAVAITRMTFAFGTADGLEGGGGLYLSATGDVTVSGNRFLSNDGSLGGGFYVSTDQGQLVFLGNLAAGNHAVDFGAGALYQGAGEAWVIGNTIVDNGNEPGQNTGGLVISGGAHFTLADNILWDNTGDGGYDLYAGAVHSRLHDDLGVAGGPHATPDLALGNLAVDPRLDDCGLFCVDYPLRADSPLVNAGEDDPGHGIGTLDLTLGPRVVGAHVDIGAYESDVLFRDGFGP